MNDLVRKEKNIAIREHGKETRLRHASMRPIERSVQMKMKLSEIEDGSILSPSSLTFTESSISLKSK